VRIAILLLCLCLTVLSSSSRAETYSFADGGAVSGDMLKFDDNGMLIKTSGDVYTNVAWARFSQNTLKQLSQNPKLRGLVEVFIEPDRSQRAPQAEIKVNPPVRLEFPASPSLLGGFFKSSVGLFLLLAIYFANLYAAYEISIIRARAIGQVVGLALVLPIIAPIIFVILPMPPEPEEEAPEEAAQETRKPGAAKPSGESVEVVEAQRRPEKKAEPQVFSRGKFTFNKRFVETKFASYVGELKPDAAKFSMSLKTGAGQFSVERIAQVGATEAIFETTNGQIVVPFGDIHEIVLTPRA
jgi:hypothetical protein